MPADVITATLDIGPLLRATDRLDKATSRIAMRRSLTKAKSTMHTTAKTEAKRSLNLTGTGLKVATKARTELRSLSANVTILPQRIPLIYFRGTRQTQRGVSIKVKPTGARTRLKHAFIATMDSGHTGVFERNLDKQIKRKAPKYSGLRIREKVGPQVINALNRPRPKRRVITAGATAFNAELARQVNLALRGEFGNLSRGF